jgi:C4-type Zn-finger protein
LRCPVCESLLEDKGEPVEKSYQGQKFRVVVIECKNCGYVNHREVK